MGPHAASLHQATDGLSWEGMVTNHEYGDGAEGRGEPCPRCGAGSANARALGERPLRIVRSVRWEYMDVDVPLGIRGDAAIHPLSILDDALAGDSPAQDPRRNA